MGRGQKYSRVRWSERESEVLVWEGHQGQEAEGQGEGRETLRWASYPQRAPPRGVSVCRMFGVDSHTHSGGVTTKRLKGNEHGEKTDFAP